MFLVLLRYQSIISEAKASVQEWLHIPRTPPFPMRVYRCSGREPAQLEPRPWRGKQGDEIEVWLWQFLGQKWLRKWLRERSIVRLSTSFVEGWEQTAWIVILKLLWLWTFELLSLTLAPWLKKNFQHLICILVLFMNKDKLVNPPQNTFLLGRCALIKSFTSLQLRTS